MEDELIIEKVEAVVGLVKNEKQWELIQNKKWYHMPATDGNQHFATQEAIDADKRRDELLSKDGWKILRFNWDQIHSELEKCFNEIKTAQVALPACR